MTAAMCQGNKLEKVRDAIIPTRFFDVGICESHAVAFAAGHGQGRYAADCRHLLDVSAAIVRPDLPGSVRCKTCPSHSRLDRAGLTGPDGPTHHGVFDIPYMRLFPNMALWPPGDERDVPAMLRFAVAPDRARLRSAIPRQTWRPSSDPIRQIELGKAEVYEWGEDGCFLAYGTLFPACVQGGRATQVRRVGRRRHQRPVLQAARQGRDPEGGRAVAPGSDGRGRDAGRRVRHRRCLRPLMPPDWTPDRSSGWASPISFIEHGERAELLASLGLDVAGLCTTMRTALRREAPTNGHAAPVPVG